MFSGFCGLHPNVLQCGVSVIQLRKDDRAGVDTNIDWLSFTRVAPRKIEQAAELYHIARRELRSISNEHEAYIFDGTGFDRCASRPPFSYALERLDHGVRIYGGGPLDLISYEISGRACEGIRGYANASEFLAPIVGNLTRLDCASDIAAATRPSEFSNQRSHKGFRNISFISSDTGETVYVGSPKSDRFCRCYRYNPPHPRSGLLRVEFVFRKGLAKSAGEALINAGSWEVFTSQLGNTWGFTHPVWQPGNQTDERLKSPKLARGDEKTEVWLYKQVAPAIQRLLKETEFDLTAWLEFVFSEGERA